MLLTDFKISKQFLRYSTSKSEATTGTLLKAQTKTTKKDYFTKSLSSLSYFFEINTSNFQEMFPATFEKLCQKKIKKITKYKFY